MSLSDPPGNGGAGSVMPFIRGHSQNKERLNFPVVFCCRTNGRKVSVLIRWKEKITLGRKKVCGLKTTSLLVQNKKGLERSANSERHLTDVLASMKATLQKGSSNGCVSNWFERWVTKEHSTRIRCKRDTGASIERFI